MSELQTSVLHPAVFALTAFVLAVLAAIWVRKKLAGKPESLNGIKEAANVIVINILLPILVFDALIDNYDNILPYIFQFAIGIAIPFVLIFIARAIFRNKQSPAFFTDVAVSTFGGGNRGVALMLLSAAILAGAGFDVDPDTALGAFIALDLGNFFFFLTFSRCS